MKGVCQLRESRMTPALLLFLLSPGYLCVPTKSSQTRWCLVIYALFVFETITLGSSECIPHPRREQCAAANISSVTRALVVAPSVPPVEVGSSRNCTLQPPNPWCVFPALRDSGQPLCSQWALHRHLRLCPGPDRAAGDEVLCKPHWVCSQQGSTQLAPAFWGFFWRGRIVQGAIRCTVRAEGFFIILF